jgi:hypothetical protein
VAHRRALAARQDEAGHAVEVGRQPDGNPLDADRAERLKVFSECPLQGKDSDSHELATSAAI